MAFDTFDEGVTLGGVRSKNEIRILICYLLSCVKENMDKELVVQAITIDELANYFEVSAAFDDLIKNGNIKESEIVDGTQTYELTDNGKMIANQLESILSYTVKDKVYVRAIQLLGEKKKRRENSVDIKKTENGFDVICKISGGDMDLLTFTLYAPTFEQAMVMKKNFYDSPSTVYKVMLALMTKDKENVGEALEELYGVL